MASCNADNIKVVVRVRKGLERDEGKSVLWTVPRNDQISLVDKSKSWTFDSVIPEDGSNESVFE